ncbi:unnamed protein product [Dracunculus medinensis]|uniref:ATP-dependent DNA helicase n=1 Tax=Dracunculus medinensis TaxID=318479 RepID=A0A0N4UBZ5_DRAME|nr:unnamed protein product [Dracunculus medinensis]
MAINGCNLSLEMMDVEKELKEIDENISLMRKRKEILLQKKREIEKRINARNDNVNDSLSRWENDEYPWTKKCYSILHKVFRLDDFRPLQRSVINAVLSNEDAILIMSTGGGKSLCYQLPAIFSEGITLVVSPLVSLIEDQLYHLRNLHVEAATINQATTKEEVKRIENALVDSRSSFRLLYVTPEKLAKSKRIMNKLEKCAELNRLKLIAIDEVHCCSQWGNDFRPDFKFLNILKRIFKKVPILGLTATATTNVIGDVKNILSIPAALEFRADFNRPNLFYEVLPKSSCSDTFVNNIVSLIKDRFGSQSGIIYCFSRKECENLAKTLRSKGIKAAPYQAFMENEEKTKIHQKWVNDEIQVIVATVAFGMGIDKPDVRFVIHHSMAKSMGNYYQESGRAGRDGNKALCLLYYSLNDLFRLSTMVCTEKTGITNLYSMLDYCLESRKCRRSIFAKHFDTACDQLLCNQSCDICKEDGNSLVSRQVDVTECWRTMTDILEKVSKKKQN